jgi:hypothetical protein
VNATQALGLRTFSHLQDRAVDDFVSSPGVGKAYLLFSPFFLFGLLFL